MPRVSVPHSLPAGVLFAILLAFALRCCACVLTYLQCNTHRLQVFTAVVPEEQAEVLEALVRGLSPNARRTYALAGTFKYELPQQDVALGAVFDAMAAAPQAGLAIRDWGVRSASLEDVFIRLAQEAVAADTASSTPSSPHRAAPRTRARLRFHTPACCGGDAS
jgi:hypothetical protein